MSISAPKLQSIDINIDAGKGERQYRRTYLLVATTPPDSGTTEGDILTAMASAGLTFGSAYGTDAGALLRSIALRLAKEDRKAEKWYWEATPAWLSRNETSSPSSPSSDNNDPTQRPVKINVKTLKFTGPAHKDSSGDPVQNTAGDKVIREKKRARLVITIEKAFTGYNAATAQEAPAGLVHSRNLTTWNPWGPHSTLFGGGTVGAGKAFLEDLSLELAFDNGLYYVNARGEFHVDDDQFKDRFWSEGYRGYRDLAHSLSGQPPSELFDTKTGMRLTKPAYLDVAGIQIAPGGAPYELVFQNYPALSWAGLSLP